MKPSSEKKAKPAPVARLFACNRVLLIHLDSRRTIQLTRRTAPQIRARQPAPVRRLIDEYLPALLPRVDQPA